MKQVKLQRLYDSTWIVIAAYFEENSIRTVLDDLQRNGYFNIVVVDDGSTDKTSEIAKRKDATVLHHVMNRGQGAALQTGITYALSQGAQFIVTFDADGQHQASDIQKLLQPLVVGEADVCLGSRFLGTASEVPLIRKVLLKCGVVLMYLMYGIKLTDSHNGLRAFTRSAAEKIKITTDRMEHASQILEEIMENKLRYREIPVTIKYTAYSLKHGQSSLNAVNIAYQMLKNKFLK